MKSSFDLELRQQTAINAHRALMDEVVRAFGNGGQTMIETPGFAKKENTLADALGDHFASQSGEAMLNEIIHLVGRLSNLPGEIGLRASALIAGFAREHADFHADDAADQEMDRIS